MIKHTALLSILVVLLVSGLMYSISPGEVRIVYSAARNRMSTQASYIISETLYRGANAIEQMRGQPGGATVARNITLEQVRAQRRAATAARNITPDPFHPFPSRDATAASRFLSWLQGPQAIAVWVSMLAGCLAARFLRKKRFEFALQERMAITLSKAVRQL